jgi:uncharacterized protein (TIGR00255 family)
MTMKSMTGFARSDGAAGILSWHWEVRSVNGRGLDIRTRVPPGFEALETRLRDAVNKRLSRGSVNITLAIKRTQGEPELRLNEKALDQVLAAIERLKTRVAVGPPAAEALLNIKGLIELVEPEESEGEAQERTERMLASLDSALDGLVRSRAEEGARLQSILSEQIASIAALVAMIERMPARTPEAIRQRLKQQVDRLLETGNSFDENRLHQEAVLLAARADIEEELKRLSAHIAAAKDLVKSSEPVGRKFDFLSQEFNREANTLCSKANDTDITRAGLELKVIIDQMREQVQNIE